MRGFPPPKPAFRGLAEEEEDETVKVLVLSALQEALNSTPVQRQLVAALDLHTQLQAVFVESKHLLIQQLIADLNLGSRLTALLADRKIQEQMMTDSRRRRRDEEAEKQRDRRAQPADVPAGAIPTRSDGKGIWPTANVHAYWRRQAHRQVELPHALFFRWHQETQSQLFDHLLQLWPSDVPRTMVDLGCHAGHSEYYNTSDALRWLLRFHHPGSHVVGVDAVEDYALDLQHRFDDVEPFRSMTGVRKQALALAISRVDGETDTRGATSSMVNCCFGFFCGRRWDNLEREGVLDHMCRIARQRVGLGRPRVVAARAAMPLPNSSQPNERAWRLARRTGQFSHPFRLRSVRLDTLWREALGERHIDFIKVDVDMSWAHMGMEGLLQARGFSVMTIEVDATWGGISAEWGVTAADQLAWLAARHGYRTLLKVACHGHDAQDRGFARYVPLCASQCLNRAPRSAPPLPSHRGGLAPPAHAARHAAR